MLRLLGLFIDNKLECDQHTKIICGRLVGKITHLEALKNKASFKTLKEVTMAHIHSTIEFVAELYLREHKNQMLIQKKLKSCLSILLDKEYGDSVSEMLYSLGWLNVTNMRRGCCIQTLKRILAIPCQVPHLW